MLLKGIPAFWLKCLGEFSKEKNLIENVLNSVFMFRSLLVSCSDIDCFRKSVDNCRCPNCSLAKVWAMYDHNAVLNDFEMVEELYNACVQIAVELMSIGYKSYWLDEPVPFYEKEYYDDQVSFYFSI